MYERTNYLAVGAFILIGAIVLVAVGAWVGGVGQTAPTSRYVVVFERDVNGLSEGSPVRYLGVDVGQVTRIRLVPAGTTAIEVTVDIERTTPVDSGTFASLGYQGITGVAFINLGADPGEHEPLAAGAGDEYPTVRTRDVGIAALLSSSPEMVAKVNGLLEDAGVLLGEDNRRAAAQILDNLARLTDALAQQQDALADVPVRMNESLDELQQALELASGVLADARPDLLTAAQNLRQASEGLNTVTGQVAHWLQENDAAVDSFLAGGVGETAALVAETRAAIREIEKLGAELRSNPSRLVHKPNLEPLVVSQ